MEAKSMRVLEELAASVHYITENMLKQVNQLTDDSDISSLRVAFKMVVFLCLYFISATTLKKPKTGQGDIITEAMNKEKGRKRQRSDNF
jgi:hypothetical protein